MTEAANNRRLTPPAGLLVDRKRPIRFRFEGKTYTGLSGDSVASALAAEHNADDVL